MWHISQHPAQQLRPRLDHQIKEAAGKQHQRVAQCRVQPLAHRAERIELRHAEYRRWTAVPLPVAVVLVMVRMAARPGILRQAIDDAEQEPYGAIDPRAAEQRVVSAVVHQRERARQK